jgi:hypothetical protein
VLSNRLGLACILFRMKRRDMSPDTDLNPNVTFKLRFSDYFTGFSDDTEMTFVDTDYGFYLRQCMTIATY